MLFTVLIFIIILFLYVHIVAQYKKSEDLEIYEMDYTNNQHLQEVCDLKQPVLFEFKNIVPELFQEDDFDNFKNSSQDVKVKDTTDIEYGDYITLPVQSARTLMQTDPKSRFFSEKNEGFMEENLQKKMTTANEFLKPTFTVQIKYDIMFGSKNVCTPIRYHTEYRKFLCVNSGKIHVKMTPWRSHNYLYPYNDYEHYEFVSPVNCWNPQEKYLNEMDKLKFLEFDVKAGNILYIPPHWFYSIKYSDEPNTIVYGFTYNSIMNCVANLPKWSLYFFQQQNLKKKVLKTLDVNTEIKSNEVESQPLPPVVVEKTENLENPISTQ